MNSSEQSIIPAALMSETNKIIDEENGVIVKEEPIENITVKVEDEETNEPEDDDELKQDTIFELEEEPEIEISKKTGKPKRKMTQTQKDNLAKAREKSCEKRKQMKLVKLKEKELKKAERTKHIRLKQAKQAEEEAQIAALAQNEVMKQEKSEWDQDRLVNLMNTTMDTYFEKRRVEKTKRAQIPMDPADMGYYKPAQPPQRQGPPAPAPMSIQDPRNPNYNPYASLFNLH